MSRIHNKANFLKGIVRKLIERDAEMANSGGRGHQSGPPPSHYGGGDLNGGLGGGRHY